MAEKGGSGAKATPLTERRARLAAELRANLAKRRGKKKRAEKAGPDATDNDTKKPG